MIGRLLETGYESVGRAGEIGGGYGYCGGYLVGRHDYADGDYDHGYFVGLCFAGCGSYIDVSDRWFHD